jgi:hypothetical protein
MNSADNLSRKIAHNFYPETLLPIQTEGLNTMFNNSKQERTKNEPEPNSDMGTDARFHQHRRVTI